MFYKFIIRTRIGIILLLISFSNYSSAQTDTLYNLFYSSYKLFELLRNDYGVYRDSKVLNGSDFHPASIASTGMGLISLCIADAMDWIDDADELVVITLKTLTGNNKPFSPDRNKVGFFRHFIDMETGDGMWEENYSTVDNAILLSGVLFCANYFNNNDSIQKYTGILFNSYDWSEAIENSETGGIYMLLDENGNGVNNIIAKPFNEYITVAWLLMNSENNSNGNGALLWNNSYANPDNLPMSYYEGIQLLTDHEGYFLSSFIVQFSYFLCHYFSTHDRYLCYFSNMRKADSLWWRNETYAKEYEWGLGAGVTIDDSYYVCSIHNNPHQIVSPHIMAGFIPVFPNESNDLITMFKNNKGVYELPGLPNDKILWRYSLLDTNWRASSVQGIDFSTMLLGLASLPQFLGTDFFIENNNFSFDYTQISYWYRNFNFNIFPNPFINFLNIYIENENSGEFKIDIIDIKGKVCKSFFIRKDNQCIKYTLNLNELHTGLYIIEISTNNYIVRKKIFKK